MAKKQQRIKQADIAKSATHCLGNPLSVVLTSGAVFEVLPNALQEEVLLCTDASGRSHSFPLYTIYELIRDFPVAEHAQTSSH